MNLYPKDWLALPDGRRYQGETLQNSGIPHGLGIVTLGDDHHFYVGEFAYGKRHGRGFLLTHKEWDAVESVWVNGTYEEVMKTAEFDCCGRVIHVDRVGHYEKLKVLSGRLLLHTGQALQETLTGDHTPSPVHLYDEL